MTVDWRDWEMVPKPQSDFAKIFGAPREYEFVRKAMYRDGAVTGRHLHRAANWTREEAKHFLLHDAAGRALLRDTGGDIDALADHLVEASARPTNKQDNTMQNLTKTLREVGEHGFTKMIENYAKTVFPTLTRAQAFTKVFTADDAEGRAIRSAYQIAKQGVADEPDDDDEADDAGDALREIEALAADIRRRFPALTKAQAFTKAYTDPANAKLAQRERAQNRPRA